MARWRAKVTRLEPPSWYRVFDLAAWDTPDAQEQTMMDGNLGHPWPDDLHRWHAERRWHQAQFAYRREHPDLAAQELEDIINRRAERREQLG